MDRSIVTIGSLCSGVGWLDLGVDLALEFLGRRAVAAFACEREGYAANVLRSRMEDSSLGCCPVWCGDLESLPCESFSGLVDVLTAGFPCQPWSAAGSMLGTSDERWLWPAIVRIVRDLEPRLVFLENVPGLVSGGGLEHVLYDLAEMGFDAEWLHLSAEAVGASHRRERVFILAYSLRVRGRERSGRKRVFDGGAQVAIAEGGGFGVVRESSGRDGQPDGGDEALGDSAGQRASESRRASERELQQPARRASGVGGPSGYLADAEQQGPQGERPGLSERRSEPVALRGAGGTDAPIFAHGPSDPRWRAILAEQPWLAPAIESGFCVFIDGQPLVVDASRADQLRCAGNGVVPLQAACAFVELLRRVESRS